MRRNVKGFLEDSYAKKLEVNENLVYANGNGEPWKSWKNENEYLHVRKINDGNLTLIWHYTHQLAKRECTRKQVTGPQMRVWTRWVRSLRLWDKTR